MINFYHRLDNSFFCLPFVILNEGERSLSSFDARFFTAFRMTGAFVCFLDSYLLFFLFGLSNCLRIRGYFIKYPRIFNHVSVDISLRIHGYAKFLLCLRGLLVVCFCFCSYCCFCFCSHKSHRSHEIFFHRCFLFHANLAKNAKNQVL